MISFRSLTLPLLFIPLSLTGQLAPPSGTGSGGGSGTQSNPWDPPSSVTLGERSFAPFQLAALLRSFPANVPVELGLLDDTNSGNSLILEFPAGTAEIHLEYPSGNPVRSFIRYDGDFHQLTGAVTPDVTVTQFDGGPRLSIPTPDDDDEKITVTTDDPDCGCDDDEKSPGKTGDSPELSSPTDSPGESGVSAGLSLGSQCCGSNQTPGNALWAPDQLSEATSPGSLIPLPNQSLLGSGSLIKKSGTINGDQVIQWLTPDSLVHIVYGTDSLTLHTYLDPQAPIGNSNTLQPLVAANGDPLVEESRTEITSHPAVGNTPLYVRFKSYFHGSLTQHFKFIETFTGDVSYGGTGSRTVTMTDILSDRRTIQESTIGTDVVSVITTKGDLNANDEILATSRIQENFAYQATVSSYRLISRIRAFGEAYARTTTYSGFNLDGEATSILNEDNSWVLKPASHSGLPAGASDITIRPFENYSLPNGNADLAQSVVTYRLGSSFSQSGQDFITRTGGHQTGRINVRRSYNSQTHYLTTTTRRYPDSNSFLTSINVSYAGTHPDIRLRGRPVSSTAPDLREVYYDYQNGDWDRVNHVWTAAANGPDLQIIRTDGHATTPALLDNRGERVIRYQDREGRSLASQRLIRTGAGSFSPYALTTHSLHIPEPSNGFETWITERDGRTVQTRQELSLSLDQVTNEVGTVSQYQRDASGRLTRTETFYRSGPHLSAALSRVVVTEYEGLTSQTITTFGPTQTITSSEYDLLGRMIRLTDASGGVTEYDFPDPQTTIVSRLGTPVSKTTRNLDGSLSTEQKADPDNNFALTTVAQVFYDIDPAGHRTVTTDRWPFDAASTTRSNWLGWPLESTSPSPLVDAYQPFADDLVTTYHYDTLGRRTRVTTTAANTPDQITVYDSLGEISASGSDLNNDGSLTLGTDRMTTISSIFTQHDGLWWRENVTTSQASANAAPLVATSRTQVEYPDPSLVAQSISISPDGATTNSRTLFDVNLGHLTTVTDSPRSDLDSTRISLDGLTISATSHLSPVVQTMTYQFDGGRFVTTHTDARGGVSKSFTNALGQTVETKDPVNNRTLFAYGTDPLAPSLGQLIARTNGEGETVTYDYNLIGQKVEVGGATYPLTYTYDLAGRMTSMTTFREQGNSATASTTRWEYLNFANLLSAKIYDDGGTPRRTEYQYDSAGRLKERRWARTNQNGDLIATSYAYSGAGDLQSVSYNDGTPTVTYSNFDLFGRALTVNQTGIGQTDYQYHLKRSQLISEIHAPGHSILPDLKWTHRFRNSLTQTGLGQPYYSYLQKGAYYQHYQQFEYDGQSRTTKYHAYAQNSDGSWAWNDSHSSIIPQGSFEPGSVLAKKSTIASIYGAPVLETTNHRDSAGRLNSAVTKGLDPAQPGIRTSIGYSYDRANRRTHATREDGTTWHYSYNDRGEVTGATKLLPNQEALAGHQFGYTFDDIGNRKTATFGGGTGAQAGQTREISYTANAVNQYETISHTRHDNVFGLVDPASSVTVNGQVAPPDRQGPRFRAEVDAATANNQGEWFDVEISIDGTSPNDEGSRWIPPATTSPEYDLDGNLTKDDRWNYQWNGENRLVRMTPIPAALAVGHPHKILEFSYDHQGRRIQKRVLDGANNNAVLSDRRFAYHGWNLKAEFEANTQNQISLVAQHFWKNDLSGSAQGAGGVGGLFMSRLKRPASTLFDLYFPSYDGNGNIIAWLDRQGQTAQRLDYDAFGNQITKHGTLPGSTVPNFGFSTKYQDQETGLLYYGYRYYDPVTGRWSSRDPIGERGGFNLYLFINNRSINAVDVSGLFEFTTSNASDEIADVTDETIGPSTFKNSKGVKTFRGPDQTIVCGQQATARLRFSQEMAASVGFDLSLFSIVTAKGTVSMSIKIGQQFDHSFKLPSCDGEPCDGSWTARVRMDISYDKTTESYTHSRSGYGRRGWDFWNSPPYIIESRRVVKNTYKVTRVHIYLETVEKKGKCCVINPSSDEIEDDTDGGE